jgi:hypothetical protein
VTENVSGCAEMCASVSPLPVDSMRTASVRGGMLAISVALARTHGLMNSARHVMKRIVNSGFILKWLPNWTDNSCLLLH